MSVNAIAFAVLRILHNLIYFQKSFLANNCNEKMRKVQWTIPLLSLNFQKILTVLSKYLQYLIQKMFLVSYKNVFIENEAAVLCITMWKSFALALVTIYHKNW